MEVQKVTDPAQIVTDPVLLAHLARLGVDQDYVELAQDYASAEIDGQLVKGRSPYAKFYRDRKSGQHFAVISQLPMVDADGNPVLAGWQAVDAGFEAKNNLFTTRVLGLETGLSIRNDQPDGRKSGQKVTCRPRLFLDGVEQVPVSEKASLLAVDPLNSQYAGNTLEWDYGICNRRLRVIEGGLFGYWLFTGNPGGAVEIRYSQQGDFRLRLGQYSDGEDRESITADAFRQAEYPLLVSDSATFNPNANPESTSVDGYVYHSTGGLGTGISWPTLVAAAGSASDDSSVTAVAMGIYSDNVSNKWRLIYRGIFLFDTSSLPDDAVINAATLSLYGYAKLDGLSATPNINIYLSAPASNTALAAGDFDSLGATAFCDTPVTYAGWSTSGYNDFTLNVSGIANISKTGISKFGARNANYDVTNTAPTWVSNAGSYVQAYTADKGTGYKPKLVVTYTSVTAVNSSDSGAGTESSSLSIADAKTSGDTGTGDESISSRDLGVVEAGSGSDIGVTTETLTAGDDGTISEASELMKTLYSADGGSGADGLKILSGKAGADMRLRGKRGHVSLPHKEVSK